MQQAHSCAASVAETTAKTFHPSDGKAVEKTASHHLWLGHAYAQGMHRSAGTFAQVFGIAVGKEVISVFTWISTKERPLFSTNLSNPFLV